MSWGILGSTWTRLGPPWWRLGPFWGQLGRVLGRRGGVLGRLGPDFGASWAVLNLDIFRPRGAAICRGTHPRGLGLRAAPALWRIAQGFEENWTRAWKKDLGARTEALACVAGRLDHGGGGELFEIVHN